MHPAASATLVWAFALACLSCNDSGPSAADADAGDSSASGAGATSASGPTRDAELAIARVLDEWHAAAARADENAYFSHFAPEAIFLGTDATERWNVPGFRAYARPHFARGKAWAFKSVRRAITVDRSGRIAWFDEDLATQSLGPARGSGVMVRAADATWKIAQYNLAITVPNQRFVEVKDLLASPPGAAPAATSSEAVPATSADAGQPTSADAGPRPPIKK